MQLVDLDTAVGADTERADDESGGRATPSFLSSGRASRLRSCRWRHRFQEDCRAVASVQRTGEATSPKPIDLYSYWFQNTYPQPVQRQRFLRKLIDGKPISHSNFRLAHLLSAGRLANLVITPNFDDFLSRALTLFGQPHAWSPGIIPRRSNASTPRGPIIESSMCTGRTGSTTVATCGVKSRDARNHRTTPR